MPLLKQKESTCYLALHYLTQVVSNSFYRIQSDNLSIIACASMIIASKFDELDYNLVNSQVLLNLMKSSPHLDNFEKNFNSEDMASCEEEILKNILKWNLFQVTSY